MSLLYIYSSLFHHIGSKQLYNITQRNENHRQTVTSDKPQMKFQWMYKLHKFYSMHM